MGTDKEETKFAPEIMAQTDGSVCTKDDGMDQEAMFV